MSSKQRKSLNMGRHSQEASNSIGRILGSSNVENVKVIHEKSRFKQGQRAVVTIAGKKYPAKVVTWMMDCLTSQIISYEVRVKIGSRRWVHESVYPDQIEEVKMARDWTEGEKLLAETKQRMRQNELNTDAAETEIDASAMVQSGVTDPHRARLEEKYGKVWTTDEMREDFEPLGFGAPFLVVRRKSDGVKGSLEFQHAPRFYFNFKEA